MNQSLYSVEDILNQLVEELQDAVDFMETFEGAAESFGEEGLERLDRKVELLYEISQWNKGPDEIDMEDGNHTVCDKCEKVLDMMKNEDIYLEPLNMVLCGPCNNEHKGIEKYWTHDNLTEYYESQMTVTEWCPHCETEAELKREFKRQPCTNCGVGILPCAQCETQKCSECPLD